MYQFSSPTLMKNSCNRLISQYFNTTENTREPNTFHRGLKSENVNRQAEVQDQGFQPLQKPVVAWIAQDQQDARPLPRHP